MRLVFFLFLLLGNSRNMYGFIIFGAIVGFLGIWRSIQVGVFLLPHIHTPHCIYCWSEEQKFCVYASSFNLLVWV